MEPKFEGLTSLAYEPCCMGQYLGLFGLIKILYDCMIKICDLYHTKKKLKIKIRIPELNKLLLQW